MKTKLEEELSVRVESAEEGMEILRAHTLCCREPLNICIIKVTRRKRSVCCSTKKIN